MHSYAPHPRDGLGAIQCNTSHASGYDVWAISSVLALRIASFEPHHGCRRACAPGFSTVSVCRTADHIYVTPCTHPNTEINPISQTRLPTEAMAHSIRHPTIAAMHRNPLSNLDSPDSPQPAQWDGPSYVERTQSGVGNDTA